MNAAITRKTQELTFALLRISAHIRRSELRRTLERLSYHLLENISYQNPEASLATIEAIRNFVVLGKNIYEIETINAKILDRELEHLAHQVRYFAGTGNLPDLETLFTKELPVRRELAKHAKKQEPPVAPQEIVIQEEEIRNEEIESGNEEIGNEEDNQEDGNSIIRKGKIVALISTSIEKKLHLKEITSAFPEVSERTIRSDLKKLVENGQIVRQGAGGPSNYYTLNQSLTFPSLSAPQKM